MDVSLQPFKRVFCWFKLLKLWGALRSHDSQVPPATLSFDLLSGLQGEIMRARTTGVGRRVEVVQFFVSAGAWLVHEDWLHGGIAAVHVPQQGCFHGEEGLSDAQAQ